MFWYRKNPTWWIFSNILRRSQGFRGFIAEVPVLVCYLKSRKKLCKGVLCQVTHY